jgi:triacylglycerol esterase/lipase EstA (alpha/beta hydrolase family)
MTLPTIILPGYLAGAIAYLPLQASLNQQGIPTTTVPLVPRSWWVTIGGRPVSPILQALDQTIQQVTAQYGVSQVNLIGHSAGGWIARIYLGEEPYCGKVWQGKSRVHTLITLGTPHSSLERWTKRNLEFVNLSYPGAFHPDVRYVCVAGKAIYGQKSLRFGEWFTYQSYQLTCGQGDCWGDGITPVSSAHLSGAENLTLEGVFHAPKSSPPPDYVWYGSPAPLKEWMSYLA